LYENKSIEKLMEFLKRILPLSIVPNFKKNFQFWITSRLGILFKHYYHNGLIFNELQLKRNKLLKNNQRRWTAYCPWKPYYWSIR